MIDLSTWPGDFIDGNPCCYYPAWIQRSMQEQGLGHYYQDLKGYGIPSQGLPRCLQSIGKHGWIVSMDAEGVGLLVGNRWEQTCEQETRAYLGRNAQEICEALEAWKPWIELLMGEE